MKILITGGAGFIASQVAAAHVELGDEVTIIDNLSTGRRANIPAGSEFHELDIRSEEAFDLIAGGGFDVVNHHAAQLDVRVSVADPILDASINTLGLLNLIRAAEKGGVGRFLFASSGGVVYGPGVDRPTGELAAKQPLSPYGVSKLSGEYYLFCSHQISGLDYVAMRYSNVFGPRQNPHGEAGVIAIFCGKLREGSGIRIFGDGEQTRDYVYVGDVVDANLLLAGADLPPATSLDDRAFNVGTGRPTSVNRLAELLMELTGVEVPVERMPARDGELQHSELDAAKLRALGWRPRTSLGIGLDQTYESLLPKAERRSTISSAGRGSRSSPRVAQIS